MGKKVIPIEDLIKFAGEKLLYIKLVRENNNKKIFTTISDMDGSSVFCIDKKGHIGYADKDGTFLIYNKEKNNYSFIEKDKEKNIKKKETWNIVGFTDIVTQKG